jgi:hypothetical protein
LILLKRGRNGARHIVIQQCLCSNCEVVGECEGLMANAIAYEGFGTGQEAAPRAKGLRPVVPVPSRDREAAVERVGRALHDVNNALATVVLCIEFLAEQSNTVGSEAVLDAQGAVRRISGLLATLRDASAAEVSDPET